MLKLDLHLHSQFSDDATGTPKEIMSIVKKKGLNGVAFTDHNSIKGGLQALKDAPKDFLVIPGVEISTKDGHLLAFNVRTTFQSGLPVAETVDTVLDAGGLPIVPHLYRNMSGIKKAKLKEIHTRLSAIEVFNGCSLPNTNLKTARIAKEFRLGGTGGSDSHHPEYAGTSYTLIDTMELTIDAVLTAIQKKQTWGEGVTMPLTYRQERMQLSLKQFFKRGFKRI
ncbi:MAG: CehA/McbA family metallohydrolase [Candidatus Thermoplasmatota archaeon]|nr:CehA/McbA family metallohydrolase [Candidatus Thermoplasmatota archaeon]MBU1941714.1 CehA/McbA family metallohydrolase [Candidatus Thermoplasmatota archaeon]